MPILATILKNVDSNLIEMKYTIYL